MLQFLKKCCCTGVEFNDIDVDQNGLITMNEFHSYILQKTKKSPTIENWMRFHLADKNGNCMITKSEFDAISEYI